MDIYAKRRLLHLLFPNRCPVCGGVIGAMEHFCGKCRKKLTAYTGEFTVTGADGAFAAFEYNKNVSPAVFLLKNGRCGNGAFALGGALAEVLRGTEAAGADLIVPVPLHIRDRRARGYDQAALIAKETGRILGIALREDILRKSQETLPQKTLGRKERQVNLRDAFEVTDPALIKGRSVLLIDDVCTTGSTLEELTACLRAAGAEKIWCAACCKTPELNESEVGNNV